LKRPVILWPLLFLLLFLAVGGLYGGIAMLIDPAGDLIGLAHTLPELPVSDFILPGLFLLLVMGIMPLLLIYGLLARPGWTWAERLFHWSGHHWAWTGTLLLGIVLAIWLIYQAFLISFEWPIQYITAVDGFLIILFLLMPGMRTFYTSRPVK
jgi:hypothetical protein